MTCIIASLCKEGIILASDGRAREIYRSQARTEENAQKVFQLSDHVGIMAYGEGPKNYDGIFTCYRSSAEVLSADGPLDMAYWRKHLPRLMARPNDLRDRYESMEASGGFIMAGFDVVDGQPRNPHIVVMQSANAFEPQQVRRSFKAAGVGKGAIAMRRLAGLGDPATLSATTVSVAMYESICATAKRHKKDVNTNVVLYLLRPGEMQQVWPQ